MAQYRYYKNVSKGGKRNMKILIWEVRNEKGVSLNQLAAKTGIGKATLWRMENGEVSPRINALERIARALGVKVEDLYESDI